MITAYKRTSQGLQKLETGILEGLKPDMVWIDLLHPTPEEESAAETALGFEIPTREELQEIEISSRLFTEGAATYLTATMICNADGDHPHTTPVTFILTEERLVTVRYEEPRPFKTYPISAEHHAELCLSSFEVLLGLLDAVIERTADILERVEADVDSVSQEIFVRQTGERRPNESGVRYREILRREGRSQLLTLKIHESLTSIGRVVTYLSRPAEAKLAKGITQRLKTLTHDLDSLGEHSGHLSQTLAFLQDATLGLINIEQNEIIKIFSIAAVVLLPPTLVASIYGMNFQMMPELKWAFGYPWALFLMILAAFLPYWYFKRRGWF